MIEKKPSFYLRIVKSSILLGGSSLITIFLRMIRIKVLALYFGPAGLGMMSLYMGFIEMVASVASLGIGQSAVRSVASSSATNDKTKVSKTIKTLQRVVWVTGLFGLIVTAILSEQASLITFNNNTHVWAFITLSLIVFLSQIHAGQVALLSGLRLIRKVASANILGAFLGTILSIPLLITFRDNGIVLFLIAIAVGQLIGSWWFAKNISLLNIKVTWQETLYEARSMIHLGLVLMFSGIALAVSTYLIRVIIRFYLGEYELGIYQAAFTISGIYIIFILQAMSTDYYPHLTAVSEFKVKRNQLVNEQAEMAILFAVPGLIALLLFSDVLIWLLYSDRFAGASDVLRWQVLGMIGRIISWPMGFILLARSDKKAIIWSEVIVSIIHVLLVWIFVKFYGTIGAGIAFAGQYLIHVFMISWIVHSRHSFVMSKVTRILIIKGVLMIMLAFITTFISIPEWKYTIHSLLLVVSLIWVINSFVARLGKDEVLGAINKITGKIKGSYKK